MRACGTGGPGLRFERGLVEEWDDGAPWDAIVFLQTIEHVTDPGAAARALRRLLAPGGVAYVSTPNRLTLAPAGADRSDNPWHVREYTPAGVPRPRRPGVRQRRAPGPVPCTQAARPRAGAAAGLGPRARADCASRGRSMTASCRRSASATSSCAAGRSSARWTCWRCAGRDGGSRPGGAVHPAPLPHALRGGLRHLAVWRGVAAGGDGILVSAAARGARAPRRRRALAESPRSASRRCWRTSSRCPGWRSASWRSCAALAASATPRTAAGLERAGSTRPRAALRLSAADYEHAAQDFERRGGDILGALRALRDGGAIDLWASCATHAVLPLLATDNGVRMQVEAGVAAHRRRFGSWSGGFWLPECAYRPGVEDHLARAGVQAFCVDQTRVADPLDHLEPIAAGGAVAVPLDWSTVSLVWDDRGYPSDAVYRDYHAQTVNGMRAWANGGRPYDRDVAHARAREHAAHFVEQVMLRADAYRAARARPALVVCALDTELLGHWWYEGPVWLDAVIAEADRARARARDAPGSAFPPRAAQGGRPGVDLGHRQGPAHLGLLRRSPMWFGPRASPSSQLLAALGSRPLRRPLRRLRGGPHASCWPCSPATGPSWPRGAWRPSMRVSGSATTRSRFARRCLRSAPP